jgi:hypothetical protein
MSASSLTSSTSAIRPRNRRLISIDDPVQEASEAQGTTSSSQPPSFTNTPAASRGVSPIPSKHPSRSTTSSGAGRNRVNGPRGVGGLGSGGTENSSSSFTNGLWGSSWSSIQGLASSVLGNEGTGDRKDKPNGFLSQARLRNPLPPSFQWNNSGAASQWGPAAQKEVGVGTKEERRALVQARKRETLLSADSQIFPNDTGRFKRKGSDDRVSISVPPEQREVDSLVYIHHVKPEDTMAGVTIKYCCQPGVFRRANRFWPNDSIQRKKTVLLPVEACGVKGKPVPPSEDLNLLDDGFEDATPAASKPPPSDFDCLRRGMDELSVTSSAVNEDPLWKHESWVRIEGFPAPVEIGRISSQALGFFPTARRKSYTFSDRDTPSVSLDLPRIASSRGSPATRKSRSSSGSYFIQQLQGPGGVGTLGKDVSIPGPPQDSLNKIFAPHLPNVAPRSSFDSITSNSSTGIENVGGAIEGWVRKMASKAATIIEAQPNSSGGKGDLIELNDAFEIGAVEEGDENLQTPQARTQSKGKGSTRVDQDALLRERFPPRGRTAHDDTKKNKGD